MTSGRTRTLRRIEGTSHAPYAIRYVTDDGTLAVNYTYSLTRNLYDAQAWRFVKGRLWQRVGETIHTPARHAGEITEAHAARVLERI